MIGLVRLLPALASALLLPGLERGAVAGASSRRDLLAGCGRALAGISVAAAAGAVPAPAFAEKSKGYVTLDEYNKRKAQELKDEKLYGKFEAIRSRADQTGEFDKLVSCYPASCGPPRRLLTWTLPAAQAEAGDFKKVSELSKGWEASIRKDLIEPTARELEGAAKSKADEINKLVLADLKAIDKLVSGHTVASPLSLLTVCARSSIEQL